MRAGVNQDKNGLHSPSGQAAIFKENQGSSLSSCEMWDYHMEFNSNLGILKEKKKMKEIKQSLWALNNLLEWVFFSYAHFMDEEWRHDSGKKFPLDIKVHFRHQPPGTSPYFDGV